MIHTQCKTYHLAFAAHRRGNYAHCLNLFDVHSTHYQRPFNYQGSVLSVLITKSMREQFSVSLWEKWIILQ